MERYLDVMKKSLELSETTLEGLFYIQTLFDNGKREDTGYLFDDVLLACTTIERTISQIIHELDKEYILNILIEIIELIEIVFVTFGAKDYDKVQKFLNSTLIPSFSKLKEELESAFRPYVIS